MVRRGQKNSAPLYAEPESTGGPARAELIKLIRHRLHEPLGPTLLVLQLLLREESLSPQGVALIRMLQRSIKEEVRAIHELLTIIETFIQEPTQADSQDRTAIGRILPIVIVLRQRFQVLTPSSKPEKISQPVRLPAFVKQGGWGGFEPPVLPRAFEQRIYL